MNNRVVATLSVSLVLAAAMSQAWAHEPQTKAGGMKPDTMGQMDMGKMNMGQMDMSMTGNADQDFAMMMRDHHQKALPMARDEVAHGKDASMRRMAQSILDTQTKEIGQFDAWLAQHPMSKNHPMSGMPMDASMPGWKAFAKLDKNHDGYLTHKELPRSEMLDQHFSKADANHDGKLSKAEVDKHRAEMMQDMHH